MKKIYKAIMLFTCLSLQSLIAVPTLGGMQLWNDIHAVNNYKIQQNIITGHCRVLEDNYWRQTFGSEQTCRDYLNSLHLESSQKQVFLIHGLGRSHWSMKKLGDHLTAQGYQVHRLNYASLLQNPQISADNIQAILAHHQAQSNFIITHSNGGILFRMIAPKVNYRAAVQLACPNRGSKIVDTLKKAYLHHLMGPNGKQLASDSELIKNLAQAANTLSIAGAKEPSIFNLPFGIFFDEKSDVS